MPFFTADGAPSTSVALLQRDARLFQLAEPLRYVEPGGATVEVPAHDVSRPPGARGENASDLASVPFFFWGLIAPFGLQTRPALLHDHLVARARAVGGDAGWRDRVEADRLFRVALVDVGVSRFRALLMWVAVVVDRYRRSVFGWARVLTGVLQLLLGVVAVVAGVALAIATAEPRWLALGLLPLAVAAVVPRDRLFFAAGPYLIALTSPFLVAQWAVSLAFLVLSGVVWLLSGARGAPPRLDPRSLGAPL